jgi:cAMP-dependent protein kinase regulator
MSQLAAGAAARAALPAPHDPNRVGHDWLATLAEVPLFHDLPKRHLRGIAKLARIRRFAPGSTMVRTGDPGRSFYVLLDGKAKVIRVDGKSRRLGVGDYFGEMALLDDAPRSAAVVADGEVLALTLLRTLAARLRAAERTDA